MHTVDRRDLKIHTMLFYCLIGQEVKIYTASLLTVRAKLSCKLLHIQEHFREFLRSSLDSSVALPAQRLRDLAVIVFFKKPHHAIVGQTRVHMDDRF